jgi:peptidoglycan/LPS O-acetylase OafA/YrhL
MTNYKNITLFEGLNSLRFFAAFLVVLHHAETIRKKYELPNFQDIGLFRNGDNAVTFFFVLSGFLITYLLLKENKRTNTISIKNFYIKRVLRIWPLYFLLVIIGTLIVPFVFELANINYQMPYTLSEVWFYFLFFLPGLVTYFFGHHLLEPLWSIGIEEVFYLIWAPLFKIGKQRIFVILVAIFVIKVVLLILAQFWIKDPLTVYLIQMFRFEAMAIGGLGAFFIFNRKSPLSELSIYKKTFQVFFYGLLISYLVFYTTINNGIWNFIFHTPVLSGLFIDFLFLYLIVGVSLIDHNIFKLRNKFLNYLGEISYGIYMYHLLLIFGCIQFLKNYLVQLSTPISSLLFYTIVIVSVIAVSSLSKVLFENYFLNFKNKLEK